MFMTGKGALRRAVWSALLCAAAVPAAAAAAGLPSVSGGHRPGPDALYALAPVAPQLENGTPWTAAPILISGTSAYRRGEWLYQDFLHDDRGAAGTPDPNDPIGPGSYLFSPATGTLTYPTDKVFANNAADLVELRVKPLSDATALRVTFNTLQDAERTAFTVAIGDSEEPRAWPHGAGVRSPAQLFLTVHGTTAELLDATTGGPRSPAPTATVDMRRRQIDVRIPDAAWDPGRSVVRLAAGAGLWDKATGSYVAPRDGAATETAPGGASPLGAALFNVAFRFDEPLPDVTQNGAGYTIGDAAAGGIADARFWREKAQAEALRLGDVSPFFAAVDFGKLVDRVTDDSRVPTAGPMDRILASNHVRGQGVDHSKVCFEIGGVDLGAKCEGRYVGQLQTYALYVPRKAPPPRGWGITLQLHSLSANYNQYLGSKNQSQFGERGPGSLVATPSGRGPDGWYSGIPEADAFEVWADVARHYPVDGDWAAVSGYSMGGFGTFRLLARWPDLFGRGMSTVGAGGSVLDQLASLRNTPLMTWAAAGDELVNVRETEESMEAMADLGLRFDHWLFPTADHLTLATNDEYGPAADFLGEHRADRNPAHVTYVVDPTEDSEVAQAVADHAYWLSGLRVRDAKAGVGTIDARSEAFGTGDPVPSGVQSEPGTLEGGSRGPVPYQRRFQEWGPAPAAPKSDRLVVRTTNVASATIDARRAGVSCAPQLDLQGDPVDLKVACPPARRATRCGSLLKIALPHLKGRRIVTVTVMRGKSRLKRTRGRNVRRVVVRRPTRRAFALRVLARTNGKRARTVTLLRRFGACG